MATYNCSQITTNERYWKWKRRKALLGTKSLSTLLIQYPHIIPWLNTSTSLSFFQRLNFCWDVNSLVCCVGNLIQVDNEVFNALYFIFKSLAISHDLKSSVEEHCYIWRYHRLRSKLFLYKLINLRNTFNTSLKSTYIIHRDKQSLWVCHKIVENIICN